MAEETTLFPTFDIPEDVADLEELNQEEISYGIAPLFDFGARRFVVVGGKVAMAEGFQAWAQWCVKACLTERYAFLVYTDDYGIELEAVSDMGTREEAEVAIEDTIIDALEADPRTASVEEFTYTWEGDAVLVSFAVTSAQGSSYPVEVRIRGLV